MTEVLRNDWGSDCPPGERLTHKEDIVVRMGDGDQTTVWGGKSSCGYIWQ